MRSCQPPLKASHANVKGNYMKILALDTATPSLSVAVADGQAVLAEITLSRGETHSKHLMPVIKQVLGLSGLAVADLDGFAVTRGPGSFTGLRIGISTIKGLATAVAKPLAGVSSLDALAVQAGESSCLICPLLDARRKEVYFARYRTEGGVLKKQTADQVGSVEAAVPEAGKDCLFIGNGAGLYKTVLKKIMGPHAHFEPGFQNIIRASAVAHLGREKIEKNQADFVETFEPIYLRKSDAEIKSPSLSR